MPAVKLVLPSGKIIRTVLHVEAERVREQSIPRGTWWLAVKAKDYADNQEEFDLVATQVRSPIEQTSYMLFPANRTFLVDDPITGLDKIRITFKK